MRKHLCAFLYSRNWSFWFTALLLLQLNKSQAQHRVEVGPKVELVDGTFSPFNTLQPGDTLVLLEGKRDLLILRNLVGTPDKPVVIINGPGGAEVNSEHYFGISIRKCKYIRLSGTGDPGQEYGIRILNVRGSGLSIGDFTSDFEVDHVEIANTLYSGLIAKTEPDCDFQRSSFLQENTVIHDCYIHEAGNEGMYIGSSFYSGQTLNCSGIQKTVMPPLLKHVRVYNNRVEYSGWDGIQVSSATDAEIFNNTVKYDSQAQIDWQMTGITLGGGSTGAIYNNHIEDGEGTGIFSNALGDVAIFNNIILNPGKSNDKSSAWYGIYVADEHAIAGMPFQIFNNLIEEPKKEGIRFNNTLGTPKNAVVNNAIAKSNFTGKNVDPEKEFMALTGETTTSLTNYLTLSFDQLQLANPRNGDFTPSTRSPLVDAGTAIADQRFNKDIDGKQRNQGFGVDIGPVESSISKASAVAIRDSSLNQDIAFPNPVPRTETVTIQFDTELPGVVDILLVDQRGQLIRQLSSDYFLVGHHFLNIDAAQLESGLNLLQVQKPRHSSLVKVMKDGQ